MSAIKYRTAPDQPWQVLPILQGEPGADGKDYVLTEEDKQEIAGMVEVSGGSTAADISYDDTATGLGTTVQQALDALADDDVSTEVVQEMIDENRKFVPTMAYGVSPLLSDTPYLPISQYITANDADTLGQMLRERGIAYTGKSITASPSSIGIISNMSGVVYYKINGKAIAKRTSYGSAGTSYSFPSGYYVTLLGISTFVIFQTKEDLQWFVTTQLKYDNSTSGLAATTLSGAIDELAARESSGGVDEARVQEMIDQSLAAVANYEEASF